MYPVIQPYHMNFLQVDARHHIYFEEVGILVVIRRLRTRWTWWWHLPKLQTVL